MKYIGENAIKKLISLIKGDLATKQDSIAATGVLERDTTGVINGVETVGATLVETQEATLVDVPNGLLKGDGTTISAAVAGTDYVNSSQAIRYDAAQTLTDAQKKQARANIAAAPDGFGLGTSAVAIDDYNNAVTNGWYRGGNNYPSKISYASYGMVRVDNNGITKLQTFYAGDTGNAMISPFMAIRKSTDYGATWSEWEYVNPPMQLGVEYRTTERYLGKPVYCKLVDFGTLPNNATKNVSLNIDNPEYLVGIWGNVDKNFNIPSNNFGGGIVEDSIVTIWTNLLSVYISTNGDRSIQSAIILVKYTKTTD